MISRNLNFTGRRRIEHDMFDFELREGVSPVLAIRKLELEGLELSPGWPILLEGRARDYLHREALGQVAAPRIGEVPLAPEAFYGGRRVRWRLIVIDTDDRHRRIAAMAENIRLIHETDEKGPARSLLPVRATDLGHLPWRVELDIQGFVLEVSRELPGAVDLPAQPGVAGWILPAVLREILTRLHPKSDDVVEDDIREPWLQFARIRGQEPPDDPDDWSSWVDDVVAAFCARHRLTKALVSHLSGEE